MNEFDQFSSKCLFNQEYLNDYNDGGSQIFAHEGIIFPPCIPRKRGTTLPFHRVTQRKGSFVVVIPRAPHAGFNYG